jgi:hypothetical protein
MCGAPEQTQELPPGTDLNQESVVVGKVTASGQPVGGAYVRLLDGSGEFTAEVVSSATGDYRFYAAPGTWTVRALSRSGNGQTEITLDGPGLFTSEVSVA